MDANQEADHGVLMSSKPLHRFVQREPRSLGVTHQTIQGHSNEIVDSLCFLKKYTEIDVYTNKGCVNVLLVSPASSSPYQIVILICGCAELLMGFQLASESVQTSCEIYIPFWQGFLVHNIRLVSGSDMLILHLQSWKKCCI